MTGPFRLTIRGEDVNCRWSSVNLATAANAASTFAADIYSDDAAFRVALWDEVIFWRDSTKLFAGLVDSYREQAESGWGTNIVTSIACSDNSALLLRRYVTGTFPAGTLKALLTTLVSDYLAVYGVTLHDDQPDGPTLPALTFTRVRVDKVLEQLAALTSGYVYQVTVDKALLMAAPSSIAAPFSIAPNDGHVVGDVEVSEERADQFANVVTLVVNGAGAAEASQDFVSDGSQTSFVTDYPAPNNIQLLYPNQLIVDGVAVEPVSWGDQLPGAHWRWDWETHTLSADEGVSIPASGKVVTIAHAIAFPFVATAQDDDDVDANGPVETIVTVDDTMSLSAAAAVAAAEVSNRLARARVVNYTTQTPGLQVGQLQSINEPYRDIDGSFVINEIRLRPRSLDIGDYEVSAVGRATQGTFRDTYKQWAGGSTNAAAGSVLAPPAPTLATSTLTAIYLGGSRNTAVAPAAGTYVDVPEMVPFTATVDVSGVVRVTLRAHDAGVAVTARLWNDTDGVAAGTSDSVTSTTAQTTAFAVSIVAGKTYHLQVTSDTSAARISALGVIQ
jgi:hypothetical protein